jgi:hypothetical protein
VAGLVVIGALVFALLSLTSGGGNTPARTAPPRTTNAPAPGTRTHRAAAVNPSSVTVSVLNGTPTNAVAKTIAQRLVGDGYRQGLVANAPDQTHTSTVVAYLTGFRRDALAVAKSLGLGATAVSPVDANTQSVACPQTATCTSEVVVTVGSDLAGGPAGTGAAGAGGGTLTGAGASAPTTTAP